MFSHGKVPSWYFITRGLNLSFASWRTDSTIARCSWLSSSFICNLVLAKLPVSVLACWFWRVASADAAARAERDLHRSEEHTSELQSLMCISYAVFCLKKKNKK